MNSGWVEKATGVSCSGNWWSLHEAKEIYLATTPRQALNRFQAWEHRRHATAARAVACLREDLDELLAFLDFPESQRVKFRTTNVIKRCFREVRRWTRPIGCFTNTASCDRIIYAVFHRLNTIWQEKSSKEFTQFSLR